MVAFVLGDRRLAGSHLGDRVHFASFDDSGAGPIPHYAFDTDIAVHSLVGIILLFLVFYVVFQQVQLSRFRKQLAEREELFRLISENAADMIAVVFRLS